MFIRYVVAFLWSLFLALLPCSGVLADEFHYNNFLIGDRASGMGGAYTAVSDDPSGMYYNPAGIAYSTGKSLSASVNAYYYAAKKYDNVIAGNAWNRTSTSLLPNFFGIVQPLDSVKVGFSYAVPDSITENQDQAFYNLPTKFAGVTAKQYLIQFKNEDNTYNYGPSIAWEAFKDFSAGLTLYIHQRTHQQIMNQRIDLSNGTYEWINTYYELNERGVKPILGLMWSPVEKTTVGLSVAKTYVLNSSTKVHDTYKDSTFDAVTLLTDDSGSSAKRKYPTQIRAGVAYFPTASLLTTLDVSYYSKVNGAGVDQRESVFNGAIGMEYYLSKNWALRAGLFSDTSNSPDLRHDRIAQTEQVDLFGGSLSFSHFTRNTSVTLGGSISQGSGKAQIISNSTDIQNVSISMWALFLSSSYSY